MSIWYVSKEICFTKLTRSSPLKWPTVLNIFTLHTSIKLLHDLNTVSCPSWKYNPQVGLSVHGTKPYEIAKFNGKNGSLIRLDIISNYLSRFITRGHWIQSKGVQHNLIVSCLCAESANVHYAVRCYPILCFCHKHNAESDCTVLNPHSPASVSVYVYLGNGTIYLTKLKLNHVVNCCISDVQMIWQLFFLYFFWSN